MKQNLALCGGGVETPKIGIYKTCISCDFCFYRIILFTFVDERKWREVLEK